MTEGQQRAVRELRRLSAVKPNTIELIGDPLVDDTNSLIARLTIQLGAMDVTADGLDLREREEFILLVPHDFPFRKPIVVVDHLRFAGFPHVIWGNILCIYQSDLEWNPSDGLYGFFDRLNMWLGRAAINDMDPVEGPLEPPHHVTDFSQIPFIICANAPCLPGESWMGLAILKKYPNRIELVGWNDLSGELQEESHLAFAIVLPSPLPMEFPSNGKDLFIELEKAGMQRERIIQNLALASLLTRDGDPIHLVVGLPMRRNANGSPRLHIDVWTCDSEKADSLRMTLPKGMDSAEIGQLREDLSDTLLSVFECSTIKWCKVFEDRNEIVVRRDNGTPLSWIAGKRVLVLGCGAIGSWVAEMVARAMPKEIHLVDNSIVKPGILARQNFVRDDIGSNKADALAQRLKMIGQDSTITSHEIEAHAFITSGIDGFRDFDLVLDCTASSIFQMKIERDWSQFDGRTPPILSMIIDAQAKQCLCTLTPKNAIGGIWHSYMWLKWQLCNNGRNPELVTSFYSDRAVKKLFQPEPGCSDPTFVGSMADVINLASGAMNIGLENDPSFSSGFGAGFSATERRGTLNPTHKTALPKAQVLQAGNYRVYIHDEIFETAREFVKQNNHTRSKKHETGGLLWGFWDDAVKVILIFDLTGPPQDSEHNPAHFLCGVKGTEDEHNHRADLTHGACGFIGLWHTHPDLPSRQSLTDMTNMTSFVSSFAHNQKRCLMLIFGRNGENPTAGFYVYESNSLSDSSESISVGESQITLKTAIV